MALSMRPRLARLCVLGATLLLASCPEEPCPPDACAVGTGRDAGADGTADSGADGAGPRPDVGPDAQRDAGPDDPVWALLPDLPPDCVIERAEHPERLRALSWASCGEGCLRARPGRNQHAIGDGRAFFTEGRGWLATVSEAPDPAYDIYTILPVDDAPVAAWRSTDARLHPSCSVGWGSVNEGRAGVIAHWHSDSSLTTIEERLLVAPIDELGANAAPLAIIGSPDVGGGLRFADELAVGSDAAAVHLTTTRIIIHHAGALTRVESGGYDARVAGDHVVWEDGDGVSLWHWTPEAGIEVYYTPPEPTIRRHFVDDGTLVWVRSIGEGATARDELWTSPLARTPAGVVPRLVDADAGLDEARYADGIYVSVQATGAAFAARLVDIADGRVRILRVPEPDVACVSAPYVSRTEVFLRCGGDGEVIFYRIDPRTLPYEP